jgi:hypothetical protein
MDELKEGDSRKMVAAQELPHSYSGSNFVVPIEVILDWALDGQLVKNFDLSKNEVTTTIDFNKLLNYLSNRFGNGPEQMLRLLVEAEYRKAGKN